MIRIVLALTGLLALEGCGAVDSLAGNGSETTTGIAVRILDTAGHPVAGVAVQVRPSAWVAGPEGSDPVRLAVSDAQGTARLPGLPAGRWSLLARSTGGGTLAQGSFEKGDGELDETPELHLSRPGALTGKAEPGARIATAGLPFGTLCGSDGTFRIDGLPAGRIDLRASSDTSQDLKGRRIDSAAAGSVRDAGTISLQGPGQETGWRDSLRIAASLGAGRPDTLLGYPLLVRLDSILDFRASDGTDLLFSLGGRPLAHEVAQWDPVGRTATVWVRLDTILPVDTSLSLTLRYGGSGHPDWSAPQAVFPAHEGWVGAWHLEAADPGAEATSRHRATDWRTREADGTAGKGRFCDTGWLRIPEAVDLRLQSMTLSCWARRLGSQVPTGKLLSKGNLQDWHNTWALQELDASARIGFLSVRTDSLSDTLRAPRPSTDAAWSHVVLTWDVATGMQHLYLDGSAADSSYQPRPFDYADRTPADLDLFLGANFIGTLDEVRISSIPRSPSWIALDQSIQKPGSASVRLSR